MRRCALALIILLTVSACDISHVKPQQTVVISGRALTATGTPLSHVQVTLYKEADFGEFVVGAALALGSLGGVCLFQGAPAVCHKGREVMTDANGGYRFTVKGSDTQGLIGDASTLDVVFADPKNKTGPSTTVRFKAQAARVRLPAARLWNAGLHVSGGSKTRPTISMSWHAHTGASGYSAQLLDPTTGLALWTQSATSQRSSIDARVLEDHTAAAAVTARISLGSGVDGVYLSARKQLRPATGAPPSRHQPCAAVTGTTHIATFKQTVCVATDGDLAAPAHLTATNAKVVCGVQIDLGHARHVSLVVARGLVGSVVIEVSTNGRSWHRVGTATGDAIAVHPPGHPVARYVRVRAPSGLDESLLSEVSVW
jgi:hypothetical protein